MVDRGNIIIPKHQIKNPLPFPKHTFQDEFGPSALMRQGGQPKDSISWPSQCGHMTQSSQDVSGSNLQNNPGFLKARKSILTQSSFLLTEMRVHWLEPQQSPWATRGSWQENSSTVERQTHRITVPDACGANLPSLPPSRFPLHERKICILIYSCSMIFDKPLVFPTPQLPCLQNGIVFT